MSIINSTYYGFVDRACAMRTNFVTSPFGPTRSVGRSSRIKECTCMYKYRRINNNVCKEPKKSAYTSTCNTYVELVIRRWNQDW